MVEKIDLPAFLENQVKLEKTIVESARKAISTLRNEAVTMALRGISLDSEKHAEMYRSALKMLEGLTVALDEEELDAQR